MSIIKGLAVNHQKHSEFTKTLHIVFDLRTDPKIMGIKLNRKYFL